METVPSKVKSSRATKFTGALFIMGAIVLVPIADAGTVFQAVDGGFRDNPDPSAGPIEHFAGSRFGDGPGFAGRETADMDTSDEAGGSRAPGTRAPASMDFGNGSVVQSAQRTAPPTRNLAPQESGVSGTGFGQSDLDNTFSSAISRSGVQEVAVIASDLGFFPHTLFVARDVPVRIFVTGASKNTLCIMMDSFQVRKQVRAQKIEEISFTPGTPGKYRFYCPVNGMEGTLVVKEFSSAPHQPTRTTASNSDGSAR